MREPSPDAAAVIARYDWVNPPTKAERCESERFHREYLIRMRAMQRELIQAYLPDMGLEDALRATRTLDLLARQDADEAGTAGGAA